MSMRTVFSERLKALRKEIGISQEAFAQTLGVARATLGYYEKGDRLPDIEFLDLVCDKTGCSMEYLMGYSENMKPSNDRIGADTGLSDKAIEVLVGVNISQNSDILNFLIEHPRFKELLRSMKILSYHSVGKYAELIDENFREYKYYQASGIIREICQAAYNDPNLDKVPAFDVRILGDGGKEDATFPIDPCEIASEKREIDFTNSVLESNLEIAKLLAEADKQAEERNVRLEQEEQEEREQAKHDPVLRFRRRMERTNIDSEEE